MNASVIKVVISLAFLIVSYVVAYLFQNKLDDVTSKDVFAAAVVKPDEIQENFSSVGGLDTIKSELIANVVTPMRYAAAFFNPRLKALHVPRGILFTGPPGCGKTLLARAIAKECKCTFLAVSASMLEDKYYGETTKRVEALFKTARSRAPCIVFFDEFDGLMRARSELDQGCQYSLKTQLLASLDGFDKSSAAVMVIACTNSSKSLDPAVRRRLPRVYTIGMPSATDRRHILNLHARAEKLSSQTLDRLADATEGYSGSDLLELYRVAASCRIQKECEQPDFHIRAANACAHPHTLGSFARSIRRLEDDEWNCALQEMANSKAAKNFIA